MEKPAINYIGGRDAILEQVRVISHVRSIPKEKVWDKFAPECSRAPHPYRLGCSCSSCEHILYQILEASRD